MAVYIFMLVCLARACFGYMTGVPPTVCSTMTPGHGTQEDTSLPFYVNVSSNEYKEGENLRVTLWAAERIFRGFMVQAVRSDNGNFLAGEFSNIPNIAQLQCSNSGVSHNSNSTKTEVSFTWRPKETFTGTFKFMTVFVERKQKPWKKILSSPIQLDYVSNVPTGSSNPVTSQSTPVDAIVPDTECGKTKGCFSDCTTKCSYIITWKKIDPHVQFEIKFSANQGSNRWRALGFSSDSKMGDDNILMCILSSGKVSVQSGSTSGKSYSSFMDSTLGISDITTLQDGSTVSCTFKRVINSTDSKLYNLRQTWILLTASGPVLSDKPMRHDSFPVQSKSKVDFLISENVSGSPPDLTMVKLHASLMIAAWIFFSSIGIITARNFKSDWKNTLCGEKVWFQIHRGCMVSVFLCTSAAFVIIFVKVGGLTKIDPVNGEIFRNWHPFLGITVTCLTVINPLMSLARCKPDHHLRPIFNVAHFSVGILAHILAVLTLSFGLQLKLGLPKAATYIVIAYAITIVIVEFVCEMFNRIEQRQKVRANEVQMKYLEKENSSAEKEQTEDVNKSQTSKWKRRFLLCHVIVMFGYALALVIMLIMV